MFCWPDVRLTPATYDLLIRRFCRVTPFVSVGGVVCNAYSAAAAPYMLLSKLSTVLLVTQTARFSLRRLFFFS